MQEFDANTAILTYVAQQGSAPENEIIRAIEAAETDHYERLGVESFDCADIPLLLFKLVQAKRLNWREPPGGDALGTKPLLYSICGGSTKTAARQAE
jgi:hypothetical protein